MQNIKKRNLESLEGAQLFEQDKTPRNDKTSSVHSIGWVLGASLIMPWASDLQAANSLPNTNVYNLQQNIINLTGFYSISTTTTYTVTPSPSFSYTFASCSVSGSISSGFCTPTPSPPSPSPVPTPAPTSIAGGSIAERNIDENQSKVGLLVANRDNIRFSIDGGADADLFEIDERNRLFFKSAPDYENPTDTNADGVYEVIVKAEGNGTSDRQTIRVTVRDKDETIAPSPTPICPVLNIIPDNSNWLGFDINIMLDLIAAAQCDTGSVGNARLAGRIEYLYLALLGRAIDAHGHAFWLNQAALEILAGQTADQAMLNVITGFLNSNEFQVLATDAGFMDVNGLIDNAAFLSYLYNEMGRAEDEAGRTFWLNFANNNANGLAGMLSAFTASATSPEEGGDDAVYLEKRLALQLAILRLAAEQNINLTAEQLLQLKTVLLENRDAVLNDELTPEVLLALL